MDGAPRGRLLRYCGRGVLGPSEGGTQRRAPFGKCMLDRGRIEVLLCGLHFANGLQITRQGDLLLVAETTRFRIIKINMTALVAPGEADSKAVRRMKRGFNAVRSATCLGAPPLHDAYTSMDRFASAEDSAFERRGVAVFIDALPGAPDNIRENPVNGNILIGLGVKSAKPFSLLHFAYQYIWIRQVIGKLVPMRYLEHLVPKYGLVLVSKADGSPIDSYHDPTGRMSMISEAQFHPETGDLWMGSHSNAFIGIDKAMKDNERIQEAMRDQAEEAEPYFVENRAIFKSWKDQEDREQEERIKLFGIQ